jgi:myo-inositol catabolism protein IolC
MNSSVALSATMTVQNGISVGATNFIDCSIEWEKGQ